MPIKSEDGTWICENCRTGFQYKKDAEACEERHRWLKSWAEGEITDQQLADFMDISVESVHAMTLGGSKPKLSQKIAGERNVFQGGTGILVNITTVTGNGKTQIPHTIRSNMGIKDGDNIFWYMASDGKYYIDNQQVTDNFSQGKQVRVAR